MAQHRPKVASQFAGHGDISHHRGLAVGGQPPVAAMESRLGAVGERHRPSGLALAPLAERRAEARWVAVVPGALDEQAPDMGVAGLRNRPPPRLRAPLLDSLGVSPR